METKILILAEEKSSYQSILDVLKKAGYKVDIVFNPKMGLRQIRNYQYQFVIIDHKLSPKDERDLFRELKIFFAGPILVVSTLSEKELIKERKGDEQEILFCQKPIDAKKVKNIISQKNT